MPIPAIIGIAAGLAQVVPSIIGLFKGKDAEQKATDIVNVAKSVAGIEDPQEAVNAVIQDPNLQLQFKEKMLDYQAAIYVEDTKRLETVNQTIRTELAVGDKVETWKQFYLAFWKSGWRPFWGFVSGAAFFVQITGIMFIMGYAVIKNLADVATIIGALATVVSALTTTWAIALAVLGVAVYKRSQDKQSISNGEMPKGFIDSITNLFKK